MGQRKNSLFFLFFLFLVTSSYGHDKAPLGHRVFKKIIDIDKALSSLTAIPLSIYDCKISWKNSDKKEESYLGLGACLYRQKSQKNEAEITIRGLFYSGVEFEAIIHWQPQDLRQFFKFHKYYDSYKHGQILDFQSQVEIQFLTPGNAVQEFAQSLSGSINLAEKISDIVNENKDVYGVGFSLTSHKGEKGFNLMNLSLLSETKRFSLATVKNYCSIKSLKQKEGCLVEFLEIMGVKSE